MPGFIGHFIEEGAAAYDPDRAEENEAENSVQQPFPKTIGKA